MRKLVLAAALLALSGAPASAQWLQPPAPIQPMQPLYGGPADQPPAAPRSTYDWQSGNMYTTIPQYGGGAQIYGNNLNTGSFWSQRVEPNGNQSGVDSHGNVWNYNAQSGAYTNSNGHGCIGEGYARTCW